MPRSYLIAGSNGMLGTALQRVLAKRGVRFDAPPERSLDITSENGVGEQVRAFATGLSEIESGVVLNAAAYTNVDAAEDDPERAYAVNERGARLLAAAARDAGLEFLHVSTDFVFDGEKTGPYVETDEPNPLSVYGASKLAGERAVAESCPDAKIVRTAWVFGSNGVNFPVKVLTAAREGRALTVVDDEIGSPTYTVDLAEGVLTLVETGAPPGIYHLAGSGSVSRYELAVEALRLAGLQVPIAHARAGDYPTNAARPRNSVLDCSKAARCGVTMPAWQDALRRFLVEFGEAAT